MKDDFRDWCERMLQADAQSKLTIYNLYFDVIHRNISSDVVVQFADALADAWASHPSETPNTIFKMVAEAYHNRGKSIKPPRYASRVMDVYSFIWWNLKPSYRKSNVYNEDAALELQNNSRWRDYIENDAKMTNGRGFAFITFSEEIDAIRQDKTISADDLGKLVRTKLGLAHLNQPELILIEVRYPENHLGQVAKPTAIEGCPSLIYRSCLLDNDGYGRAVNIETFEHGVREMVHIEIALTPAFQIMNLGSAGRIPFTDTAFIQHYCDNPQHICSDDIANLLIAELDKIRSGLYDEHP